LEVKVEVRVPTKAGGEKVVHAFTNCREQDQLKSIDALEPNVDGSVSVHAEGENGQTCRPWPAGPADAHPAAIVVIRELRYTGGNC
jgi:hypothetical protein